MSEKLPKGWLKTKLGEVCITVENIQPGDTPDAEFTYFDIGGIDNETNRIVETKTVTGRNAPSRARQAVRKDDILFSNVRTYLRKIALVERDYQNPVASTGFTVIRSAQGVAPLFLFYQVLSEAFLQPLHKLQTGTSYPAVHGRDVLARPILLPPTREQERIVTKLTAALSAVSRAEMAVRRARERLKRYRAGVLDAAVTGELSHTWREAYWKKKNSAAETGNDLLQRLLVARRAYWEEKELRRVRAVGNAPKNDEWKIKYPKPISPQPSDLQQLPKEWSWTNMSQLKVHSLYGPRFSRSDYAKKGVAVLRTTDIDENGRVSFETCPKLPLSDKEYEKYKVEKGDLLITRTGSIGTLAIYKDTARAIPGAYLLHYRLVDPVVAEFVYTFFRSPIGQKFLLDASAGSGRQNLSGPGLERIPIPLPPIVEQTEIIQEVKHRFSAANRLALSLEQQLAKAHTTRDYLLREAFSGRFVPQDPNDEPAAVLLERSRADRKTEAKKRRQKDMPRSKSKAAMTRRLLLDVLLEHKKPMTPEQLFREAGFEPSQIDIFYRELSSLRNKLREEKPKASDAKLWPHRAKVLLQLKKGA